MIMLDFLGLKLLAISEFLKEQFDAEGICLQCQTTNRLVTYMIIISMILSVKFEV